MVRSQASLPVKVIDLTRVARLTAMFLKHIVVALRVFPIPASLLMCWKLVNTSSKTLTY